jgi:ceramide glucosyltransferase
MTLVALILVSLCTLWTLLGIFAVIKSTRGQRAPNVVDDPLRTQRISLVEAAVEEKSGPAVSVLKPLCGADSGLEQNLETFFQQDYPRFELVFGVQHPEDPAIAVVQRLRERYPHVAVKLVIHGGGGCMNPKVDNLVGMLPHAEHDLLLVSDSNVRAPAHYVSEMVETLQAHPKTGLATNLFAGTGENTLGSALENVQLNGFCAAGAALPTLLGDTLVVGKSMLFSRTTFQELGGFERVANVLAEDWLIGKMYQHAGYKVRIATTVLDNVTRGMQLNGFLDRQLRWAMLRSRLRPAAQILEVVTSPLAMLPLALYAFGPFGLTWAFALVALRDVGGWVALRGFRRAWIPALLSPVRELALLVVWARAPLKRHVTWRGHRVRLAAGTFVFLPARAVA